MFVTRISACTPNSLRFCLTGLSLLAAVFTSRASPAVDMDYETIRKHAESGDPYYQAALAFVHLHGDKGQMKSIDQFRKWTEKSSAQAHPLGLFAMGYLGKIDGDFDKTRRFYRRVFGPGEGHLIKMAAEGDALASFCLGELFTSKALGPEVQQDIVLAALHFRIAADRGHEPSRVQYAVFRINGLGIEKNEAEGFASLLKASKEDLPAAHYYLGQAYFEGWGVEKNDNKALMHMVTAAELNYGQAKLSAAKFYAFGVASPVNWELAAMYAGQAAALGVPRSADLFKEYDRKRREAPPIGTRLPLGTKVPEPEDTLAPDERISPSPVSPSPIPSPSPAVPTVSDPAANKALLQARDALHVKHDVKTALSLYQTAADAGVVVAQRELGVLFYEGSYVDRDFHSALKWFRKAADAGDAPSQRYLGAMYFIGKGLAKDKQEAAKWLKRAAAQGDALAQEQLKMVERLLRR
ncbi:MAG: tetratricopeptide repeat protein [Opitutales bacterium]